MSEAKGKDRNINTVGRFGIREVGSRPLGVSVIRRADTGNVEVWWRGNRIAWWTSSQEVAGMVAAINWAEVRRSSGGEFFGVRVVVDDCLPQGEARLVSTTDEVRLVNIGGADAGE